MIVGNLDIFAIESEMTEVYSRISSRALGFFVIYVGGRLFGVRERSASMLACSFDEVSNRFQRRGKHVIPALNNIDAHSIAQAYLDGRFRKTARTDYLGLSKKEFADSLDENDVVRAPDGDEAFDDGSHVLQFDVDNRVRLIAFVNTEFSEEVGTTLREQWIEAEQFYSL